MESPFSVLATLPASSLFSFPPNSQPPFLPPPAPASIPGAPPFFISTEIYRAALDPKVPITIAALYAITIKLLNKYNKSTGKKPWAISQTGPFRAFVVLHNIFLAVYSAWTFWGMLGALRRSVVSPTAAGGWSGTVDSFCRLSGPSGLGNAAFFSEDAQQWQSYGSGISFAADGPSQLDTGRIWNEGLAFYGWLFYLSKFYEVLDTFIILAKGKLSSTLQTYHHAGAMMCMWAGMRYMSAPIWMFVFVNSGIHAMMYTYYTLTAFNIRVPMLIKRTLTSLQITQFLVGASYAMAHSFVSYSIPVGVTSATKITPSTAAVNSVGTTGTSMMENVKSLIFGAVRGQATPSTVEKMRGEITSSQKVVPCITSSGETFAIWLNVLYLAPLTYLFVSFFIASYIKRSSAESARAKKAGKVIDKETERACLLTTNVALAEKAGWDAAKDLEKEVYGENGSPVSESGSDSVGRVTPVNGKVNGHTNGHAKP